jgi:hypothetical protein
MGVARAPVVGSGRAPAWIDNVENPGSWSFISFSLFGGFMVADQFIRGKPKFRAP